MDRNIEILLSGVASGQVSECPLRAEPKPSLDPLTYLWRDPILKTRLVAVQMLPIQYERICSEDIAQIQICKAYRDLLEKN